MKILGIVCYFFGHAFYDPQPLWPEIEKSHMWGRNCSLCGYEDWWWEELPTDEGYWD